MARIWIAILMTAAVATCLGCVSLSNYKGDGTISKIKFSINPLIRVDFESFSLSRFHKAEYRLDGLPRHHDAYKVGLVPEVSLEELGRRPSFLEEGRVGHLSLLLVDASGEVIFHSQGYLNEMYWNWNRAEPFGYIHDPFGEDKDNAIFLPGRVKTEAHAPALLRVTYEPEDGAPGVIAKIRVTAGGTS